MASEHVTGRMDSMMKNVRFDGFLIFLYIYICFIYAYTILYNGIDQQTIPSVRKYDSMPNKYRKSMSWEYWITSEIRFLTTGRKSVTWWQLLYGCSLKPQVPRANTGVSCWIPTNEFPGAGDQPIWYEQQLPGFLTTTIMWNQKIWPVPWGYWSASHR